MLPFVVKKKLTFPLALTTTDQFFVPVVLTLPDNHMKGSMQGLTFGYGLFHLEKCTWISSILVTVSIVYSLLLSSVPLYKYTAVSYPFGLYPVFGNYK